MGHWPQFLTGSAWKRLWTRPSSPKAALRPLGPETRRLHGGGQPGSRRGPQSLGSGKGSDHFQCIYQPLCYGNYTHRERGAEKEGCSLADLELSNNALSIKKMVTVPANTPTGQRVIQSTENMKL